MGAVRLLLWGAMGVLLSAPAAAQAKADPAGSLPVRVRPLNPVAIDTLTVTFRAGRLKPDERYQVGFSVSDNVPCTQGFVVQLKRQTPGRTVRVKLLPNAPYSTGRVVFSGGATGHVDDPTRFCAGSDQLLVTAVNQDGKIRFLGHANVKIAKDAGYPKSPDTPTRITVLDGSVTVKAAGRPDRTMALGGSMRGVVPGMIRLNTDIAATGFTGGLFFKSLVPDPLCAGERYAPDLSVVPAGSSNLVLKQDGNVTLVLQLVTDPVSLAGCAAPTTSSPTTLTLTGKVGPGGLTNQALSGTVTGVPIATGVTADVTVSLVVDVDLSGRA